MRLLKRTANGQLSLTEDLADKDIPKYAILSHTWGAPEEEVSFEDFLNGTGERKPGYKKIQFCGEQAALDGLTYFWVDTCCIDKSRHGELPEAINSMFRWYRNATRCYVFLSDVSSTSPSDTSGESDEQPWAQAFRESKWFKRGWTLQELIAPPILYFFSDTGMKLGSKESLERQICEITNIHARALHGAPLSEFAVVDRLSWTENRETKYEEDMVYSILGIFDASLSPCYGEGRNKAFHRLNEQIEKDLKGPRFIDFSISFSLSDTSETEHFVARERELIEMHKILRGDDSRRTVVLQGLGGIGKTQLSVAYAKRFRHSYSAIFWLNAKDENSLRQSFINLARKILRQHRLASQLSSIDMKDLEKVVNAVKEWLSLENNTRWLMIYDNYDDPRTPDSEDPNALDICKYFPEVYQGSIIITTRSAEVDIGKLIPIKNLKSIDDGLEILSNTSQRGKLTNDQNAILLAKELDGLPLALATAGAYLKQVTISFEVYLRQYKESWAKLQKTSPQIRTYQDRALYSTWQITFERVKRQNELSAKLLQLWAYFDNQDIWLELLQHTDPDDPGWIRELTEDDISFTGAVRVLRNHGLVEVDTSSQELIESRGYSMHSCVHQWTFFVLNQDWDRDLAELALKCIGSHVPAPDTDKWWLTQRRLLQHANRCSNINLASETTEVDASRAFGSLGNLYADQGKMEDAEKMYKGALQGKEKALGAEHMSTLNTVNNLGLLYMTQGKLEDAEKMYKRALQGYEKTLGAEHISMLNTVNNLGSLYMTQGKLEDAEKMYKRALQRKEKTLGAEHLSTISTVNNLGILYSKLGKLEEAEKMYIRALQGYKMILGAEHISIIKIFNNLGSLYRKQGKLEEAKIMYIQALQGKEKILGAEHLSTISTVNNLGILYSKLGKLEEAEKMYIRALQGYEKALGSEQFLHHLDALSIMEIYGDLLVEKGSEEEAEKLLAQALSGLTLILGASSARCQGITARLSILRGLSGRGRSNKRKERA